MAYTTSFAIDIGTAGLTLKALLWSGGTVHATLRNITTTTLAGSTAAFNATGVDSSATGGNYEFVFEEIPTSFRGAIIFYTGTYTSAFTDIRIYSIGSINPEELAPATETPDTPAAPVDTTQCRIYGILVNQSTGRAMVGAQLTATRVPATAAYAGGILIGNRKSAISGPTGLVVLDVSRTDEISLATGGSVEWRIQCTDAGIDVTTALTSSMYNLGDLFP